jgi:hypothetical protein
MARHYGDVTRDRICLKRDLDSAGCSLVKEAATDEREALAEQWNRAVENRRCAVQAA